MELGTGVIIFLLVAIAIAEDVTVVTELGNITGTAEELTFNSKPFTITKFLGIPYAEPPTGTRRFHKPIKKRSLNGHFIANKTAPVCIQNYDHVRLLGIDPNTLQQAEDCLYLNIFVPGNGPIDKSQKYAVMIWIYGGSFQMGDQNTYDAKAFVGVSNVILVTFNYRVSLLGFLSTGEDNRSGNYGLWDQHEAIEWVHNHIENFGGDVMKVTIFGESAGGESVVYQALYDGNEDFFQRVIAQSGSANGPLAYDRNPSELYESYANKTGCLKEEQMETINCLRNLTVDEIIDSVKYSDMFLPVKDGDFVKVHPVDIFRNTSNEAWDILSRFGKFDLIFGVTSSEGGMSLGEVDTLTNASNNSIPTGYRRDTFESNIVPYGLKKAKLKDSQAIRAAFIHQYSDWMDPDNEPLILQVTVDLLSDIEFNAGIVKSAMAHADTGETGHLYFYVFDYKGLISDPRVTGASHAEEIPFVLGFPPQYEWLYALFGLTIPQHELDLSEKLMKYWTNFAKTGDPNSEDLTAWPEYDTETQKYIRFDSNIDAFPIETHFAASRMNFWHNLIPVLNQECDKDCPKCDVTSSCSFVSTGSTLFFALIFFFFRTCF